MDTSSIRLWQMISPSLPVGGYSYSQGLEQAVEAGVVIDEMTVLGWITGILRHGVARTDLPVLLCVHATWCAGDSEAAVAWSDRLIAMRETAELRFEDRSMGAALSRWIDQLGLERPLEPLSFAAAFAIAAAQCSVAASDAAAGYAWAWAEMQVAAAVKLVPLGHSTGQRVLWQIGAQIDSAVRVAASCADAQIGMSLPGVALASARHETQYSRLFRS